LSEAIDGLARSAAPPPAPESLEVASEAFRRGYLDAWWIRGDVLVPPVPAYSVEPDEDLYRAGVARAVRDAATKALAARGASDGGSARVRP
jgi:hypothetical protein